MLHFWKGFSMKKLRPYLALDLETTGLDREKSHILQIGWVIDDGVSPRDQLEKGSVIIRNPIITYGENYALGMNGWIFAELMKKANEPTKYPIVSLEKGLFQLMVAIKKAAKLAEEFNRAEGEKYPKNNVQIAGKNAGNFDWPIILSNLKREPSSISEAEYQESAMEMIELVDHRFIDCGAIFFEIFGKNPGFAAINKLMGWKDINHDALDDAMNVVVSVRYRMGIKE